jgi:farnesyl-diphosphate farnesyltransferase
MGLRTLVSLGYLHVLMQAEDWAFCREALRRHSRTFAIPIAMLTPLLERAITCSYLLCRIADTIEDTPDWGGDAKRQLYRALQDAVDGDCPASAFVTIVAGCEGGDPDERGLLLGLPAVLRVFGELPERMRQICRTGIGELIGGMMIYSRRREGPDGIRCVSSEGDLERYCYFVAGVIGGLLTEAFLEDLGEVADAAANAMRAHAEQFGAGLQMVNILRDLRVDLSRGVCFVPRTLLDAAGLSPKSLAEPTREPAVRAMLGTLFDRARTHLDSAFAYTLAIPASATAIRRFCLVPLWLAVATLELCRTDPGLLRSSQSVKLSRQRIGELINECLAACGDDAQLRESFALLDAASPVEAA